MLAEEKLLVPTGVSRVGSSVETDDKRKGVSLMLSAFTKRLEGNSTFECGLLPLFMVFNGKTGKTLDRRYSDWSRRDGHFESMNFQYMHWFDGIITLR